MHNILSQDWIESLGQRLAQTATHPNVISELMRVRGSDPGTRLQEARRVATVANLKSVEVPIDADFRITTRSFEDPRIAELSARSDEDNAPEIYFEDHHGFVECDGEVVMIDEEVDDGDVSTLAEPARDFVQSEIAQGIAEIGEFVSTKEFKELVGELYRLPNADRPDFVLHSVLNPHYLASRGIIVPAGMKIQRSHFDDGRPTLFCVSKYLKQAHPWHKVTVTFDDAAPSR